MRRPRECIDPGGDSVGWPQQCIWFYSFPFSQPGDANGLVCGHPIVAQTVHTFVGFGFSMSATQIPAVALTMAALTQTIPDWPQISISQVPQISKSKQSKCSRSQSQQLPNEFLCSAHGKWQK
jgi:hypothetical protein